MPPDFPELEEQKETFMRSVRRHRFIALLALVVSGLAMLGILAATIPFRLQIKAFFDNCVGGKLGDVLRGLTFAVLASPPWIAGILWIQRQEMRFEYRCVECSVSFADHGVAESVVRDNRCPTCGTMVFRPSGVPEDGKQTG